MMLLHLLSASFLCFTPVFTRKPRDSQRANCFSPLQASIDQLRGLPQALGITEEFDVLPNQGEAYAHKLMEAGVSVTATRYLGTIHDFTMLNVITDTPAIRGAIEQASEVLKKKLST
jgi:acetyl esterase